jgi:hypothetical protein
MTAVFRGGRIPLDPNAPRPDITRHMVRGAAAETVDAPPAVNYWSKVASWGELGNANWGDCTCAADGHIAMQQTAYGLGRADPVTDAEALAVYSAVSGFDPVAGPPGANPTDRGATIQSALEYLRKRGIAGFKIAAYGSVDVKDGTAIRHAIEDFGALSIGMDLPSTAQPQRGTWTVVPGATSQGGHCVMACGYDQEYVYFVSWGNVYRMTWAFWDAYVDEAWAVISEDWTSVTGLSLEAFGAEFAVAFGTKNPFAPPLLRRIETDLVDEASGFFKWFHKRGYRGVHE